VKGSFKKCLPDTKTAHWFLQTR